VTLTAGGEAADQVESRFGLRWYEFDRDRGFILNGEQLRLVGMNRHQDYPGLGNALAPRLQRADAEIIKAMGANFIRMSHYPQHPAFLDACDELGICLYAEIASWQFIGGPKFFDNAEAMLRAMIRRDANHPSIILWGLLNEGRNKPLFERLNAAAHEEDSSRPTVYADNNIEEGIERGTVWVPDVLGINYEIDRLDALREKLPGRKLLCSEHANAVTRDPADPVERAQQTDRINGELEILGARPWMTGSALWCMHDYGTDYEVSRPVQRSGALDEYRRPKESFYLLCARWRKDPVVHIEGHWNHAPGETRQVRVYTNCETVALRLNGKELGSRGDGFVRTWEVPFEPGVLEAVGVKGGVEARHEVRTHGAPAKLLLEAGAETLDAAGDACWLTAALYDSKGARVLSGQHEVTFTASGPVRIRGVGGRPVVSTIAGVAQIAITAEGVGEAVVEAAAGAIRSEAVRIRVGG
jgi:beta-galactosidase